MQVLDDQGRVFGKVNIIDAAVLLVVCLLIPLAYGAFLLFRTPTPRIIAVEPARVPQGTKQINVRGEHLRPYLRMSIGSEEARLLFESPNVGVVHLPQLEPGSYDVVVYDESQEVARLSHGLVIEAPPAPPEPPKSNGEFVAVGAFVELDAGDARRLWQNLQAPGRGALPRLEVVGFQAPERNLSALPILDGRYQVRAVLRLPCTFDQWACRVQNVALTVGATVPVAIGGGTAYFRVEELHPHYTRSVELLMKSYVTPEEVALLERWQSGALESFPAREALRPALVSFEQIGETPDKQAIIMVRLRVPAVETPNGWIHGSRLLRVGQAFDAERPSFYLLGRIVGITPSRE